MPADSAPTVHDFFQAWELFRDPALAGALAGGLLGALGVYVVVRRMVFLSAALAQSAGLGVAAAWYAQIHLGISGRWATPTVGAGAASALAAALMTVGQTGLRARRDGVLGGVYLVGAAGTLVIGTKIVQEVQDIESILFGSAVAVAPEDLAMLMWLAGSLGIVHVLGIRGFAQYAIDETGARVRGLPVTLLAVLLMGSLAAAVSLGTRILGALPVFAFTVLPPLAALRVAPNVTSAVAVAAGLGAVAGFAGYLAAFLWKWPVGAAQTLVAAAEVGVCLGLGYVLQYWHNARAHRGGHVHGPGCGHVAIRHGDHIDYLHDGQLDHPTAVGREVHVLSHDAMAHAPAQPHGAASMEPDHQHSPSCGHPAIAHAGHTDYLVGGRLHHPHGDHCDDHGPVDVVPHGETRGEEIKA